MLYVTTRNELDTVPAGCTLRENRAKDGGFYVPFRLDPFPVDRIRELLGKPFGECVAEILNHLFQCRLTAWDVDFSVGRYPVRLEKAGHCTYLAELWHNPEWAYDCLVSNLSKTLCPENATVTSWGKIAIRIAVLFGIFGQLRREGIHKADICVLSGDFSAPISAWYARRLGLPIGNVVCTCNENHVLWDLICQGQLRTNSVSIPTIVPEADIVLPEELERLIFACGGSEETDHYREYCRLGGVYIPDEELLARLRSGLYVSVVSSKRLERIVPGVYRSHRLLLSPATALTYAGLQDYRAKSGISCHAVVLSEESPQRAVQTLAPMLGIGEEELKKLL